MRNKTRLLTLLAAVVVFALIVTGITLTAFADDEENAAFKVTDPGGTVTMHATGTTFSSVVSKAAAGSTITLLSNNDVDADIALKKSLTIDLNGKTLTTTGRITPYDQTHVTFKNGTVEITKQEIAYMDDRYSAEATFEFNSVTLKKGANSANKTFSDMRVGTVILDGVTVNEGEWTPIGNSPQALISMGYRTKAVSQLLTLKIKNSNINLPSIFLVNTSGASNETNGYTIDIDVVNSKLKSKTNIFMVQPVANTAANCFVNIDVTEGSVLTGTPVGANSVAVLTNITTMLDYGVTSRKPTKGNVKLGNDGNGLLHFINGEFESSNTGTVADLWSDNQTPVAREDYAYTFVAVGDTQYITDSANPEKLALLYDWILNNKEAQNIQFVFGMGDITNHSRDDEWPVAMEQLNRLNGVVPYSVVRGNHDTADTFNANLNNETYRSMFDGFYSEDGAQNAYVTFSVGETDFLNITLDYAPSNAVLNWAAGVIQAHPNHKVIISTHAYLQYDGSLLDESNVANSGQEIWDKLVSQYPNIFLVLSGHVYATEIGRSQMTGVYGNTVTNIITDGQTHDFKNGPMGFISLLHFSEDGKKLTVEYYSTVHDKFFGKNSQFTLDIPEFDPSTIEPPTYLYEVTDENGNTLMHADTKPLSMVLSSVSPGSTVKLLGDVVVDSGCDVYVDVTIDLNGHTISTDAGRISSTHKITIKNGTIKIVKYEVIYVTEGSPNSSVTLNNIDVIHVGTDNYKGKPLAEVRDGDVLCDNVRVAAENWNGTVNFITLGSRTKAQSNPINFTIKDSNISIGGARPVYFGGNSNEKLGYAGNISIINSTITTTNSIFTTSPTEAAALNSSITISIDDKSVLNAKSIFNLARIPLDKIDVTIAEGAKFGGLPAISGVEINYGGDVFVYNNTTSMLTLADSKTVDTSKVACKLVKADKSVFCYWEGSVLNQELLTYAQNAECDIVLVGDMTTPAGTSSTSRYAMTVKVRNLTIDLGGNTLTMSAWSYFGTETASKKLTLTNGKVKNTYYVYYSYSGSPGTAFEANGVEFTNTANSASFDIRYGTVTLNNCTMTFTGSPTNVFTLGNGTTGVHVYLDGCAITGVVNIFKFYAANPSSVTATNCTITTQANGAIVFAENSKQKDPADVATFKNCTLTRAGTNVLFNIGYDSITIVLDEVYVPGTPTIEPAKGTLKYADGQVKAAVEGGGYKITAPKVQIQANLSLYIDFTLNIWLPTETNVSTITVGETTYTVADAPVFGGKHRVSIESIGAGSAADGIEILITYTDGDKTLTVEKVYSVVEYAKSVLGGEYSNEAKSLLANIVTYIDAVYTYDGKAIPTELSTLMASEAYTSALALSTTDGVSVVPATTTSLGTATNAVSGAMLSLDSSVQFIFTLNPDYTGPLSLTYAGKTYTCEVVDGKISGNGYITVNMRAFYLYDEVITITAGEYSGTYDLAAYIAGVREEYEADEKLETLLLALYNYCKEADEYNAYFIAGGELN